MAQLPYGVFKDLNATILAGHFEAQASAALPIDRDALLLDATNVRKGGSYYVQVSEWPTQKAAETEAGRRNAANTLPGVRYVAEQV